MHSRNHCVRGKTITRIYCVCVVLIIQYAMRMRLILHLWPLLVYHIFPYYLTNGFTFGKKVFELKICFDLRYKFCLKYLF